MDESKGKVQGFSAGVKSMFGGGLQFGAGFAVAQIGVNLLKDAFHGLISVGTQTFETLKGLFFEGAEFADMIGKMSDRLGVGTEELAGLKFAGDLADISIQELEKGLFKFSRELAGADTKSFEKFGLDAKALASVPLDEALGQTLDKIKELPNASQRSLAAFELFGRNGLKFLNLPGSADLKKQMEQAGRFGFGFSREQAGQVEEMNDNFTRFKAIASGLGIQLAVQIAPAISLITSKIIHLTDEGFNMGEIVSRSLEFIFDTIGVVAVGFEAFAKLLMSITASTGDFVDKSLGPLQSLYSGLAKVTPGEQGEKFQELADRIGDAKDRLQGASAKAREFGAGIQLGDTARMLRDFKEELDGLRNKQDGHVKAWQQMNKAAAQGSLEAVMGLKKFEGDLDTQIATFGLGKEAIERYKLTTMGLTDAELANADAKIRQLEAMREQAKVFEAQEKLVTDNLDPLSKFGNEIRAIQALVAQDESLRDFGDLGILKAFNALDKAGARKIALPPVAVEGSKEAFDTIARFEAGQQAETREQRVERVMREQKEVAERQLEEAKEIRKALEKQGIIAPVEF